jgi:hypothetical protein
MVETYFCRYKFKEMKEHIQKQKPGLWLIAIAMTIAGNLAAQSPSDAFMEKQGEICIGAYYNNNAWSEYWEGDSLRTNGNIGTVTTHTILGGIQLGILDRLNLFVMVPYVITHSTPEENPIDGLTTATIQGDKGFQDIALFLKGSIVHSEMGKGTLDVLATVGFSTPMSSYAPDASFPLGLGCPDGIFRGIVQYSANMGIYARGDAAYHIRGNSNLIRNYYYTTNGYFSTEVDMPDALDYNATLGYWIKENTFKAEAQLSGLTTFGGFDIRRQDGGFPSNDMDAMRIGVNAEYFNAFIDGLAISFNSAYTLTGRNVGKSITLGGGILYQFNLWNGNKATEAAQ